MHLWREAVHDWLAPYALNRDELHRLRGLTSRFLQEKTLTGVQGMVLDDLARLRIASLACLLVLNLDLDRYDGWHEVVVYPDAFFVEQDETDAAGVVHHRRSLLGGESWGAGPVILAWEDVLRRSHHGYPANVVLHEFAHKLDMGNGAANGMPPLHPGMQRLAWTRALKAAYEDLVQRVEHHAHAPIDPYGATAPPEFFAVLTETFFEDPGTLCRVYPDVYVQLRCFYRQDPAARQGIRCRPHHRRGGSAD